jgi:hypothetical protein
LFRIFSRMSQFQAVPFHVFKIQFHIILRTRLAFPSKSCMHFWSPLSCYTIYN